ncbi:MAG: TIR domain-containing protein [Thauera sp.]|nr:TIR domain-containing protein [Thauera sp.]
MGESASGEVRRNDFDVFISYNSRNAEIVRRIAEHLRDTEKLRVWLDDWCLDPGLPWMDGLYKGLRASASVAVFVGPDGLGDWQAPELQVALNNQVKSGKRVIPVLLPGAPAPEKLPDFLTLLKAVVFRDGPDDASARGRLVWGITGINPLARVTQGDNRAPMVEVAGRVEDPLDAAEGALADALENGSVTFLVGRFAGSAEAQSPPSPRSLSEAMLRDLKLLPDNYDGMVPGVEAAAALLATERSDPGMERRVIDLLASFNVAQPAGVHGALADLMRVLQHKPPPRANRRVPRLILTTSFDLCLERALLRAGLSFSRLVHHRAGGRIDVNVFQDVKRIDAAHVLINGQLVDVADVALLDKQIYDCDQRSVRLQDSGMDPGRPDNPLASLLVRDLPDPILYKFQGSRDIDNSSAISADQCFDFLWRLLRQRCIPSQIAEIIASSTLLVIGSNLLDYDFRLTYHTLLREQLEINPNPHYAVVCRGELDRRDYGHKLTETAWGKVKQVAMSKYRMELLDVATAPLLARVAARLGRRWGA